MFDSVELREVGQAIYLGCGHTRIVRMADRSIKVSDPDAGDTIIRSGEVYDRYDAFLQRISA